MAIRQRRLMALYLTPLILLALVAVVLFTRQDDDAPRRNESVEQAVTWLRTQQLPGGGFAGFSGDADPGMAADVALAFAAAGINLADVTTGDDNLLDYLNGSASGVTGDAGLAAKLALAIHAANGNPRDAGGVDLIDTILSAHDGATGWYSFSFYGHALAMLALDAAGETIPTEAVDAVLAAQTPEGSWGFAGAPEAGSGDSNTTAITIQALRATEQGDDAIHRGLEFLRSLQDGDGAVAYDASMAPALTGDANSTALAIQAFLAAEEDPRTLPHGDLDAALRAFQNESGAFQYQAAFPDDSLLATAQAIPALMGVALPYERVSTVPPAFAVVNGTAR
jgi:hypothetical protein